MQPPAHIGTVVLVAEMPGVGFPARQRQQIRYQPEGTDVIGVLYRIFGVGDVVFLVGDVVGDGV